jgi:hypothetical protein
MAQTKPLLPAPVTAAISRWLSCSRSRQVPPSSVRPTGRAGQRLAAVRPELVTLLRFPGADHVESWNADRSRYEQAVRGFLTVVVR